MVKAADLSSAIVRCVGSNPTPLNLVFGLLYGLGSYLRLRIEVEGGFGVVGFVEC